MSKTGKIILWAVIAIVLAAVLVWGIIGGSTIRGFFNHVVESIAGVQVGDFVDNLPDDAQKSVSFEKPLSEIKAISMRFVDEDIEIVATDDSVIRVEESSNRKISDEDVMTYGVKDGELVVQSGRNGRTIFGWNKNYHINVKLMIPRSFAGGLDIQTVSGEIEAGKVGAEAGVFSTTSGDIMINSGACGTLSLNSTSGGISVEDMTAQKVSANTMSGEIDLQGTFETVKGNSTSGKVRVTVKNAQAIEANTTSGEIDLAIGGAENLEKIDADSVSGSVRIALAENKGFDLGFDTVSGSTDNDFAMKNGQYGDGSIKINVNTVSGSLKIMEQ